MITIPAASAPRVLLNGLVSARSLWLYVNDHTPSAADRVQDFAAAPGVPAQALRAAEWQMTDAGVSYPSVVVLFDGPLEGKATVYGYVVVNDAGQLLWADRFDTPFTPEFKGDHVRVEMTLSL